MLGLGGTIFEVWMDDIDGPIIVIMLKEVFTLDQSAKSFSILQCHKRISVGWN
jgi:hypothetical protein